MKLQHVWVYLRYLYSQHGWMAFAGLVLLVGSLLIDQIWVTDMDMRSAQIMDELAAQRLKHANKTSPEDEKNQRLAALYSALPDSSTTLDAIAMINRAARDHQVHLATGEYRLVRTANTGLMRYQLNFPAHADYKSLRQWLAASLNAMPTLALDDLSFKREDAGTNQLDSRVRMTLYVRTP